jgi:hypothetical protein
MEYLGDHPNEYDVIMTGIFNNYRDFPRKADSERLRAMNKNPQIPI